MTMLSAGDLASWLLQGAAALPDTIVTRQISESRSWFDTVSGIASIVISLALVALAVGLLPAAWNFRKSYKKVNELLDRVYGDVNPIMRHASSVADNLDYVTTAVRQDVARLQATVAAANARLEEASRLTERRINEFNALVQVVQTEAEETFVAAAATMRGLREGAAALQGSATTPPSEEIDDDPVRQIAHPEDDEFEDERPRIRRARGSSRGS